MEKDKIKKFINNQRRIKLRNQCYLQSVVNKTNIDRKNKQLENRGRDRVTINYHYLMCIHSIFLKG